MLRAEAKKRGTLDEDRSGKKRFAVRFAEIPRNFENAFHEPVLRKMVFPRRIVPKDTPSRIENAEKRDEEVGQAFFEFARRADSAPLGGGVHSTSYKLGAAVFPGSLSGNDSCIPWALCGGRALLRDEELALVRRKPCLTMPDGHGSWQGFRVGSKGKLRKK